MGKIGGTQPPVPTTPNLMVAAPVTVFVQLNLELCFWIVSFLSARAEVFTAEYWRYFAEWAKEYAASVSAARNGARRIGQGESAAAGEGVGNSAQRKKHPAILDFASAAADFRRSHGITAPGVDPLNPSAIDDVGLGEDSMIGLASPLSAMWFPSRVSRDALLCCSFCRCAGRASPGLGCWP